MDACASQGLPAFLPRRYKLFRFTDDYSFVTLMTYASFVAAGVDSGLSLAPCHLSSALDARGYKKNETRNYSLAPLKPMPSTKSSRLSGLELLGLTILAL